MGFSESKRLVLIRHAHRNTDDRTRDNGLSEKGLEQTRKLVKFARDRLEDAQAVFLSSPKKRCQETLAPIVKAFNEKMEVDPRLDEHRPTEGSAIYLARIQEFLDSWKYSGAETTVLCSHGDWIPLAVQQLTGAKIGLKKAAWVEIEYAGGECYLTWLVQKAP